MNLCKVRLDSRLRVALAHTQSLKQPESGSLARSSRNFSGCIRITQDAAMPSRHQLDIPCNNAVVKKGVLISTHIYYI